MSSSASVERMQIAKSVLAGVIVAALTLCGIAATANDPSSLAQSEGRSSVVGKAFRAITRLQSLVDETTILGSNQSVPTSNVPQERAKIIYNDEQMDYVGQRWLAEHPQEAQVASIIWNIGLLLLLLALIVIVYSEVSTVLYYRDMDGIIAADLVSAPPSAEMRKREFLWGNGWSAHYRPGMTLGGAAVLLLTMTAMFYSECPMIDQIAQEYDISATSYSGSCSLIAFKQAVITGLGGVFFIVGLAWSCTRFLPAFLLLLLSLGADVAGSFPGAVPVLLWILSVILAAGLYLWVIHRAEDEDPAAAKPKKSDREFV